MIGDVTGELCWIDFDLYQNFKGFDVMSLGKILQFVVGVGMNTLIFGLMVDLVKRVAVETA